MNRVVAAALLLLAGIGFGHASRADWNHPDFALSCCVVMLLASIALFCIDADNS